MFEYIQFSQQFCFNMKYRTLKTKMKHGINVSTLSHWFISIYIFWQIFKRHIVLCIYYLCVHMKHEEQKKKNCFNAIK